MFLTKSQLEQLQHYDVHIQPKVNICGNFVTGKYIEILSQTSNKICSNLTLFDAKIGSYNVLNPGEYKAVVTGNYCTVGEGFKTLGKHDFNRVTTNICTYLNNENVVNFKQKSFFNYRLPVIIGHNAWLGSNVLVKNGTLIGHGAVVEDGAIVVKHVPPFAIVAGSPARIVGLRYPKSIVERMLKCSWYSYDWQGMPLDWTNIEACLYAMERYIETQQVPLLDQGAVIFNPNEKAKVANMNWTLEKVLDVNFKTTDIEQVFALPEISSHALQFDGASI